MNAARYFRTLDNIDLQEIAAQYGDQNSGFYRNSPRRALYRELKRRKLPLNLRRPCLTAEELKNYLRNPWR